MFGQNSYSSYPYSGYNTPNYGQRNYMQSQQFMQQQEQPTAQAPIQNLYFAKMEEGKPFIITSPNTSILFIDREKGKALLKATDNVCNSSSRYFNIEETDENGTLLSTLNQTKSEPSIDLSNYIKREELDTLNLARKEDLENFDTISRQEYEELKSMVENLQKKLAGVKQNVAPIKQQ
jgi:hypothetical protein